MSRWLVTQIWQYTVEVWVEADGYDQAKDKAYEMTCERNRDAHLYEATAFRLDDGENSRRD